MSNTLVSKHVIAKPIVIGYTLVINHQPIVTIVTGSRFTAQLTMRLEPFASLLGDVELYDLVEVVWEDVRLEVQRIRFRKEMGVEGLRSVAFFEHPPVVERIA